MWNFDELFPKKLFLLKDLLNDLACNILDASLIIEICYRTLFLKVSYYKQN